jgi:predicted RNA methylase
MSKKAVQDNSTKLDQFYTEPSYAQSFYNIVKQHVDLSLADILLEPSAGSGSFYQLMDLVKRIGLDLDPKCNGVVQQDFFHWTAPKGKKIVTIGNPPFGKNSSLAVKFFNRAAEFSDVIAFVLPRTFKKDSFINRLHKNFHLVYEEIVPDNSFIFNGKPYNVWCCSQIWVRKKEKRAKIKILNFDMVKNWFEIVGSKQADFSLQRVGGRAGLIRTSDFESYSSASNYFIKQHDPRVFDIFNNLNFESIKYNTVGNPSISPSELIKLWIDAAQHHGINVNTTTKEEDFQNRIDKFVEIVN